MAAANSVNPKSWTWIAWPLGALPLAWVLWQGVTGGSGPDPVAALVNALGWWALVLLLVCLTMRPAARLLNIPALVIWRRTFGLWMFIYASLHFLAWATLILGWDPGRLATELSKRPYIIVGAAAWLALWPLALTSTRKARRRMGKRWVKLHRLIFLALPLALIHQFWVQKSGFGESLAFLAVALVLVGYRLRGRFLPGK
ncbi:sulfite oxidase heme-binding subunit YedZ [Alloalcanivorax gelatiniphagus]|uniref:Protein-methionine-sulfoxide reductase heme-binding subunit MsrQ n=1 Tax=Alloalcanivorax gelatiniphagus TaxID=1194167 RepID=A0ABY2XRM9_9GAMM|nr:protein-methionine-sulfoxide reductase heme-binding subunit MsrQ [Alloalcanivorax gelatiniphagus]TMW15021.1 sulfoxide reductase heme-binding subunit YedZ [Alloalcanivorax gelatiniphagus]|tara:strand:- start:215 stop:814 length:600 start_codon:yes stop_codon:yes gene_type:complete